MSTNFTDIGAAITNIIQANIAGVKDVANYAKVDPGGYPAITVEAHDGTGQFADTGRNRREYIYRILLMQERLKVGPSEAERIMRALFDQIITVFDSRANLQLNNTCDFAYPVPSKWGYMQGTDIDVRTAEILIVAVKLQ